MAAAAVVVELAAPGVRAIDVQLLCSACFCHSAILDLACHAALPPKIVESSQQTR